MSFLGKGNGSWRCPLVADRQGLKELRGEGEDSRQGAGVRGMATWEKQGQALSPFRICWRSGPWQLLWPYSPPLVSLLLLSLAFWPNIPQAPWDRARRPALPSVPSPSLAVGGVRLPTGLCLYVDASGSQLLSFLSDALSLIATQPIYF